MTNFSLGELMGIITLAPLLLFIWPQRSIETLDTILYSQCSVVFISKVRKYIQDKDVHRRTAPFFTSSESSSHFDWNSRHLWILDPSNNWNLSNCPRGWSSSSLASRHHRRSGSLAIYWELFLCRDSFPDSCHN